MNNSQKGIAHLLLLILVVAGIGLGIYLVQNRTNILPHASESVSAPKTGFTLGSGTQQVSSGGEFYIKVGASSDFDAANTLSLVMNYPLGKVQLLGISPSMNEATASGDTFIKKWIEQSDDRNGRIIVSGAVPNPGFKTESGQTYTMATIRFKALVNSGEIPFTVNSDSAIYRNYDSQNIIGTNTGVIVKVGAAPSASVSPSPSVQPYYRVFVTNGDYNGDIYEPVSLIRGVNGADAICQSIAANSNLGGKWRAWLADDTLASGPYNKFLGYHENDQNPFRLLDGTTIADNYNDFLDGSLKQPISITEVGGRKSSPVWTNTKANGATGGVSINGSLQHCNYWKTSNPNLNGNTGNSGRTDGGWTEGSILNCRNRAALYCFDQNTTTATPGILPTPNASIQIIYPNGGETINIGSSVKVTWKQANMQKCYLRASDDKGNFLAANYEITNPSTGSLDWLVNSNFAGDFVKAKLEMECRDNKIASFYFDQSDNFFTITKAAPSPIPSVSPPPTSSPSPLPLDPKRADLYKDSQKPNFINDQDISVFFYKCAEKGVELFGQAASVQPVCDINNDGTINVPDWSILIKYRNKLVQ